MRPCFAPHAGGAAPRAARRNSPTSSTGAQLTVGPSVTSPLGERERERQSQTSDARSRPPADCAFCACTLCADCAAIAIVGRGYESLIEPATLSPLRFGDSILAAEQAVPRPPTPQARDGSALWWGSANTLGPRQVVARGAQAPVLIAVSPMRPGHSARRGNRLRVEFHCASDESILFR